MTFEKYSHLLAAVIVGAGWWGIEHFNLVVLHPDNALNATLQISASLLSFQSIAFTVLLALTGSRVIEQVKRGGLFDMLVGYFVSAIVWALIVMITSFLGVSIDVPQQLLTTALHTVFVAIIVAAIASSIRVLWLLRKILNGA